MSETSDNRVRPGQVYRDNDIRSSGERVRVLRAGVKKFTAAKGETGEPEYAEVISVLMSGDPWGSPRYLLLRRMYTDGKPRRSGYSLVEDVDDV